MTEPASDARRYQIIIRGDCGRLLLSVIDDVQVVIAHSGDTCVVAPVRDDPEFWGLMALLRDLALHIVSVQDLDHGNGQEPPAVQATGRRRGLADRAPIRAPIPAPAEPTPVRPDCSFRRL